MKKILQENGREITQVPTEGKWFKVNPLNIDQSLFKEKREDPRQELTRHYILEAFEEMKKDFKYAKPFKTRMPKKMWSSKTIKELKELAKRLGDHNADWVEQALEWAQRIANGESWEDLCNKKDTAKWYRMVVWRKGYTRRVGGSRRSSYDHPASNVSDDLFICIPMYQTVPLVVAYDD